MFNLFGKKKETKTTTGKAASSNWVPSILFPSNEPFGFKDPSRTDLLIRGTETHYQLPDTAGRNMLKTIHEVFSADGEGKADHKSEFVAREIITDTVILPVYHLMSMNSKIRFSRSRNQEAESWRSKAHEKADAFAFVVDISENGLNGGNRGGWERDRFEISYLLRKPSLIENPSKPLILLVNEEHLTEDCNVDRLVNLLGLANLGRPYRTVTYSTKNADKLKEALEWV